MNNALQKQRKYVASHRFPPLAERRAHLSALEFTIGSHEGELLDALRDDMGKTPIEAYTSEIGFVLRDIGFARKNLPGWMKGHRVRVPWIARPGCASAEPHPLGVVLILGPWNYPFQLLFSPLVGALAAGNAVCLKPSEFAPSTAQVIGRICAEAFSEDHVSVVMGDANVAADLVGSPYDHIFFTGSSATGRKVAEAAAANLTPATLELGGKSPCIVCADADLEVAARRIMWGKCLNAGQTCVAPDFVLVEESTADRLLEFLKQASEAFVPALDAPDYGRILNERHFDRLVALLEQGAIYAGGEHDRAQLKIAPTILTQPDENAAIMREEIFGPLLPVLTFRGLDEAITTLTQRAQPLALYLFTRDNKQMDLVSRGVPSGGLCVNDTINHIVPADLPFGGVGASGHGRYRGKAGFDCFSNVKSVMVRRNRPDPHFRYPPHTASLDMIRRTYHWLTK